MKKKLLILSMLGVLTAVFASTAMACGCGKKAGAGNQVSSCQQQCAGGCTAQSACSEGPMNLAMGKVDQGKGKVEPKSVESKSAEAPAVAPAAATVNATAQAPKEVGNKICPVSGDKVPAPGEKGAMGDKPVKYEYNGKIYNLCCPMCIKDFKKNPEKYSKIADDEVAKEKMMQEKQEGQK